MVDLPSYLKKLNRVIENEINYTYTDNTPKIKRGYHNIVRNQTPINPID